MSVVLVVSVLLLLLLLLLLLKLQMAILVIRAAAAAAALVAAAAAGIGRWECVAYMGYTLHSMKKIMMLWHNGDTFDNQKGIGRTLE